VDGFLVRGLFKKIRVVLLLMSSNILGVLFSPKFWHQTISNPKHSFVIFGSKILAQNVRMKC